MLCPANISAGAILFAFDYGLFSPVDFTIGFGPSFRPPDVALLALERGALSPGELAAGGSLCNPCLLCRTPCIRHGHFLCDGCCCSQ